MRSRRIALGRVNQRTRAHNGAVAWLCSSGFSSVDTRSPTAPDDLTSSEDSTIDASITAGAYSTQPKSGVRTVSAEL